MGGPRADIERQTLTIDQACGVRLDAVLAERRRHAVESGRLEDLVPLAALLADLEHFTEADEVYWQALVSYANFPPTEYLDCDQLDFVSFNVYLHREPELRAYLARLQHVAAFFRTSEPSSPIPFLIDRARELAQRDFLNLLQDVLPEGALKQFDS